MFWGEYAHQIDAKCRMRMPAPYKEKFNGKYAFRYFKDGVISVYPVDALDDRIAFIKSLSPFDEEIEDLVSDYTSAFYIVEDDPQGRVVIPKELRDAAALDKNIVIYAAGDHVNITSKSLREERKATTVNKDVNKKLDKLFKEKNNVR